MSARRTPRDVVGGRVDQEVDVLSGTHEPGLDDRHATDNDILSALAVETPAEGDQVG